MNTQTQTKLRKNNKNQVTAETPIHDFLEQLGLESGPRVNVEFLEMDINQTVFVKIEGEPITFTSRKGDECTYLPVIDLKTGEAARMWYDGGLKGALSQISLKGLKGRMLQVTRLEKGEFVNEEGKTLQVNRYDVRELHSKTTKQ